MKHEMFILQSEEMCVRCGEDKPRGTTVYIDDEKGEITCEDCMDNAGEPVYIIEEN